MLTIRFSILLILIVSTLAIINGQKHIVDGDHHHRVKRQNPPGAPAPAKKGMGKGGMLGIGLLGAGMAVPYYPQIKEKFKKTFGGR